MSYETGYDFPKILNWDCWYLMQRWASPWQHWALAFKSWSTLSLTMVTLSVGFYRLIGVALETFIGLGLF